MFEELSKVLQPYKESVGLTASIVTILQFFSGAIICRDIYRAKSTKCISALPFIGGVVIGILVLKFAIVLQDKNMFNVNVAAILLNSIYLVFYAAYSEDKFRELIKPGIKGLILTAIVLSYASYEKPENLEYRYGLIVTVLMLLLMGSPLIEVKYIVASGDSSSIPFPLTFMGFIVSMLWLTYGIILANDFMIIQNLLGTMLCFSQLVLCIKYPKVQPRTKSD